MSPFPKSIADRAPENSPVPLANLVVPNRNPNWGPVGYVTYKRTYARRFDPDDPLSETEEWKDTLERCVHAAVWQLHCPFTNQEQQEFFEMMYDLKISVAGRFLWQLGTKTVSRFGLLSLQNCAFTKISDPVRPFEWIAEALMLGSGVGFSVENRHINRLPPVYKVTIERHDVKDADFIIPDTREGWSKLVRKVLKSHFVTGKSFTYSCMLIRSKGAPIRSFGGIASGPDTLSDGIQKINQILNASAGTKITSVTALDVVNLIGAIVVSGNVRRSAQIAIGDHYDKEYLKSKDWSNGKIPYWRANSNNSVACTDFEKLSEDFWDGYRGNGEPYGLLNMDAMAWYGRYPSTEYFGSDPCQEAKGGADPHVEGINPCGEQPLNNYETCCLAEVFLPNISSFEELVKGLRFLYITCKHSLMLPCHMPETEEVVHRNMRMGIGITGYLQSSDLQKSWLSDAYNALRAIDSSYSDKIGVPRSVKLTTIKPSGTLSLLAGVTPGIHPGYAKFFIRRIRIASEHPLVEICREHGYEVEFAYDSNFSGGANTNLSVVSFPCRYPDGTTVAAEFGAVDQLNVISRLQREWSDNAVSCTVYYKKEELTDIRNWLQKNYHTLKSVSFLLHSEHGFAQAPYQEIVEDEYNELMELVTPITNESMVAASLEDAAFMAEVECEGGVCPIR